MTFLYILCKKNDALCTLVIKLVLIIIFFFLLFLTCAHAHAKVVVFILSQKYFFCLNFYNRGLIFYSCYCCLAFLYLVLQHLVFFFLCCYTARVSHVDQVNGFYSKKLSFFLGCKI